MAELGHGEGPEQRAVELAEARTEAGEIREAAREDGKKIIAEAKETAGEATMTAAEIAALLTPEGFDRARVDQLIDASAIADAQKTTLKAVIASAEGNPAILQAALDQVRAVLR